VNIRYAGAGKNIREAENPAVFPVKNNGRVIVFSSGLATSGIPQGWAATGYRSGVFLLQDLSGRAVQRIRERVQKVEQEGDIVIVSIHWGGNWGYRIPSGQKAFARRLIDEAGVDIVHGHSSHHVKGIEVYKDRPILYGCGDFLNDYEGIAGHEQYRDDLSLMYFASMDPSTGRLTGMRLVPTLTRRFQVNRATEKDVLWLQGVLNREGMELGTSVELNEDLSFSLRW
jgi:poly-gamma-glutamate synthesis protein (capsule biosynthesis protein)